MLETVIWTLTIFIPRFPEDKVSMKGFFKLVTQCSNGSIMLVRKDSPFILMPEVEKPLVLVMSRLSRLIGRLTSTDLVTGAHIIMVIMLVIMIFCVLLMTIF